MKLANTAPTTSQHWQRQTNAKGLKEGNLGRSKGSEGMGGGVYVGVMKVYNYAMFA